MTAPTLTTKLDRSSPEARARFDHNKALADDLRGKVAEAALGGSEKHRERHVSRGNFCRVSGWSGCSIPVRPFLR